MKKERMWFRTYDWCDGPKIYTPKNSTIFTRKKDTVVTRANYIWANSSMFSTSCMSAKAPICTPFSKFSTVWAGFCFSIFFCYFLSPGWASDFTSLRKGTSVRGNRS